MGGNDNHLNPSEIGTKAYWDQAYNVEAANFRINPSDEGVIWFEESDAENRILAYLQELEIPADASFLDIGTGNGHLLFFLREEGEFTGGRMLGVDYSGAGIELAREIAKEHGLTEGEVEFECADVIRDGVKNWAGEEGFDVVLDKGTFDAISLSDGRLEGGRRLVEGYAEKVGQAVKVGGWFLITSCNWTEEELVQRIDGKSGLKYYGEIKYPSFEFGGKKGQAISSRLQMPARPLVDLVEAVGPETVLEDTKGLDYFEDSLSSLFSDARNQHGEPGEIVVYKSKVYFGKDIKLKLADPDKKDNRLFAHYLWNAGVQVAEMIASGEWDVKGESVLELGAGAGLPGIVAALSSTKEVVLSDYPACELLENAASNVKRNLQAEIASKVSVCGHKWGVFDVSESTVSATNFQDLSNLKAAYTFTRIIVADCMWMGWEHENLCTSVVHFLEPNKGEMLAIAGFHTGRAKVAAFFEQCGKAGLALVEDIVELNVDGVRRPWITDRGIEDVVERKRWLTIAKFRRAPVVKQTSA